MFTWSLCSILTWTLWHYVAGKPGNSLESVTELAIATGLSFYAIKGAKKVYYLDLPTELQLSLHWLHQTMMPPLAVMLVIILVIYSLLIYLGFRKRLGL